MLADGDAERRQDHDVVGAERVAVARRDRLRKRMPCVAQPVVDVRVVDDLAGQEDVAVRESGVRAW